MTVRKKKSIIEIAENHLEANYMIRKNLITGSIEISKKFSEKLNTEINENDLFRDLHKKKIKIPIGSLYAILNSSFVVSFNPFEDYFNSIQKTWSEEINGDVINRLAGYISAEDQERFNRHFKKMLVRSVACALNPTVFNKQAFILVQNTQNSGKSSFCRWICPPSLKEYFSENIALDKDGLISLCENFLINLDELASLNKAEINGLKSVFSMESVKTRPPYGRKVIKMTRRANFIGSTNRSEFLHDETGNVRWLCFRINQINWAYQEDFNIDMIWSQAFQLYQNGFSYNLSSEEIHENEKANENFLVTSTEYEMLLDTLSPGTKEDHTHFMNTTEIMGYLIEQNCFHQRPNKIQLGKALCRLGFSQTQKFNGKYPVKGYYLNIIALKNTSN